MTLETKVADGTVSRGPAVPRAAPRQKSLAPHEIEAIVNHATLSEAVRSLADTENHPDRWQRDQAIEATIEETLATHPEDPLPTLFVRICKILKIEPNLTRLADHLVEDLTPYHPPDG